MGSRVGLTTWIKDAVTSGPINPNFVTNNDVAKFMPDQYRKDNVKQDLRMATNALARLARQGFLIRREYGVYAKREKTKVVVPPKPEPVPAGEQVWMVTGSLQSLDDNTKTVCFTYSKIECS